MIIPAPGQIWRDPRNPTREMEVTGVSPYTVCIKNKVGGRHATIKRENFTVLARKPWIFVRDAPGERAKLG